MWGTIKFSRPVEEETIIYTAFEDVIFHSDFTTSIYDILGVPWYFTLRQPAKYRYTTITAYSSEFCVTKVIPEQNRELSLLMRVHNGCIYNGVIGSTVAEHLSAHTRFFMHSDISLWRLWKGIP